MGSILYADHIKINDAISVVVPSVGEVFDAEDDYFSAVSSIVATPYDMMVQLDDKGIDFTTIDAFDLFCMLFRELQNSDTSLIFGDLDLSKFEPAVNRNTKEMVFLDREDDIVIDRVIHNTIADALRRILYIKKNIKKPGNEEARKYMIRIARMNQRKEARKQKEKQTTQLEDIVVSLVNTGEFPYTYQSVRDISIYQLYSSMHQVAHKIKYDNTMHGYYAGTVKLEDLSMEDRSWLKSQ